MAKLFIADEIIDDWHPLDGLPAPEYIPPQWDGPHVGVRLVEAFKTLNKLPGTRRMFWGCWPEYAFEWQDLLAREQGDKEVREQEAREQNKARILPTAEDISRMERALGWAAHYLRALPRTARVVNRIAFFRARDMSIDMISRRMHRAEFVIRRENRRGLDQIAEGLRCDEIAIF